VLFSFTSTCQRLGVEPWRYRVRPADRVPAKDLRDDVLAGKYKLVEGVRPANRVVVGSALEAGSNGVRRRPKE
jgi:hypothetical protein